MFFEWINSFLSVLADYKHFLFAYIALVVLQVTRKRTEALLGGFYSWIKRIAYVILSPVHFAVKHVLGIAALESKVDEIEGKVDEIEGKVDEIEGKVDDMREDLDTVIAVMNGNPDPNYGKSQSPITLTERGRTISKKIDAVGIAERHVKRLKMPKNPTPYEIQVTCFEYARNELMKHVGGDDKKIIHKFAMIEGKPEKSILDIVGIELRDVVFKQRGVDLSDLADEKSHAGK